MKNGQIGKQTQNDRYLRIIVQKRKKLVAEYLYFLFFSQKFFFRLFVCYISCSVIHFYVFVVLFQYLSQTFPYTLCKHAWREKYCVCIFIIIFLSFSCPSLLFRLFVTDFICFHFNLHFTFPLSHSLIRFVYRDERKIVMFLSKHIVGAKQCLTRRIFEIHKNKYSKSWEIKMVCLPKT